MDELSGFLDEIGEAETKRPSPRKKELADPFAELPATEARRVVNSEGKDASMVGQQIRRSVLMPPEMDEEINRVCAQYNVKKMAMLRFLLAKGLEQVHAGALEGNLIAKVTMELPTPDWRAS